MKGLRLSALHVGKIKCFIGKPVAIFWEFDQSDIVDVCSTEIEIRDLVAPPSSVQEYVVTSQVTLRTMTNIQHLKQHDMLKICRL